MEGYSMVSSSSSRRVPRTAISLACLFALMPGLASAQGVQQVNVTATRFSEAQDALPFGVSVLTSEQLRASGVSTVNEALMKLAGVPGRQDFYGGGDYTLDLRGFGDTASSNQVIVIDGVRVSEGDTSSVRLAGINIDTVERIEVIRGSGSVLYGEGATGGVISITTKAGLGLERNNNADAYVAVGSHRLRDERIAATVAANGLSLDVAANKRTTDNFRDNFSSRAEGYAVTGQWNNSWFRAGLRLVQDKVDGGLPGALTLAQYNSNPRQTQPGSETDHADTRNTRYGLFAVAMLDSWQVALDVGGREKAVLPFFSGAPYGFNIDADNQSIRAQRVLEAGGIKHALSAGLDFDGWKRTSTDGSAVAQQRTRAAHLKDDITLIAGTRLSAGVRAEHIDKHDNFSNGSVGNPTAWELGVTQPLGGGFSTYGRYGSSFRYPNADEFSYTTPAGLQPQRSHDLELGARWANRQSRIDARLYRSNLQHEIGFAPRTLSNPFPANINYDATRRQGLEVEARQAIAENFAATFNGGLRDAKFVDGPSNGKQIPFAPRTSAAVRANWRFLPQHHVDVGVMFVGSQHPGNDFANECKMPSYATGDARYAYRVGNVELAVAVSNLTNKRYYSQAYNCDPTIGQPKSIYPDDRRAAVASLRWSFF
jgi:iron complex outermembrane receptor protein